MKELLASIPEKLIVKCIEQDNDTGEEVELAKMHIYTVAQAISQTPQHGDDSPRQVIENLLRGGVYVVHCERVTRWYSINSGVDHG